MLIDWYFVDKKYDEILALEEERKGADYKETDWNSRREK